MDNLFNSQNQDNEKVGIPSDLTLLIEEKQIIIHCLVKGETVLSIRGDTFLSSNQPHRKAFLLFSFGAPIHPVTSYGVDQRFTLIFSALDKECSKFHFIESKLHPEMFVAANVYRNETDVYHLEFVKK
jgi:hypothetical protein